MRDTDIVGERRAIHVMKEPALRLRTGLEKFPYMQRIDLIPDVFCEAFHRAASGGKRPALSPAWSRYAGGASWRS
jgi:hypothetical protein